MNEPSEVNQAAVACVVETAAAHAGAAAQLGNQEHEAVLKALGQASPDFRRAHNSIHRFELAFVAGAMLALFGVLTTLDDFSRWVPTSLTIVALLILGIFAIRIYRTALQMLDITVGNCLETNRRRRIMATSEEALMSLMNAKFRPIKLHDMMMFTRGYEAPFVDFVVMRSEDDSTGYRSRNDENNPSADLRAPENVVWSLDGTLVDVVAELLDLPGPGERGAPSLIIVTPSSLWVPPGTHGGSMRSPLET